MHIWIHFKEEKKLSNTFGRYSENFTKVIEYLIELWPLLFQRFQFFEWCLSGKNKTIHSISMRKSILWLILHLHTIENTILGGVKFYEWPTKVKFQGQSRIEWFFDNIRRIVHILYTLKEGKTIIVINYVCPANYMKIDWELIELWPLLICLKTVIWGFSRAKKQTVHICIHFKEEKK